MVKGKPQIETRLEAIREKLKMFPKAPGLYFMKGSDDVVLYIGKAGDLRSRVTSYFQPSTDLWPAAAPR